MKAVGVKCNTYIDFGVEVNLKKTKAKVSDQL